MFEPYEQKNFDNKKMIFTRKLNDNKVPGGIFHKWCHPSHYTIFERIYDEHTIKGRTVQIYKISNLIKLKLVKSKLF